MDAQLASSSSANTAQPTTTIRRRISWPGGPSVNQNFALPYPIVCYIAMNPSSSNGYNKLIQTCKFFFEKNPILVVEHLTEEGICLNKECDHDVDLPSNGCYCTSKKIDINKITSKIWLTGQLYLNQYNIPNFISVLLPKIFRCDIDMFGIQSIKSIYFDDLRYLASSAKWIDLRTQVVSDNGNLVMLEDILAAFPKVEKIEFCNDYIVSSSTLKNLSKLNNLGNLKEMEFWQYDESCSVDDLFAFVKDHSHIKFNFEFSDHFDMSEEYENQLDQFVDSLIENTHLKVLVVYDNDNWEKRKILYKRYCM